MLLDSLEVKNFRNLSGKLSFDNGLNIITGDNGQGKTNWLEAIYVLATTKSYKTSKIQEAIQFESAEICFVRGIVRQSKEIQRTIQVTLEGNTKTLSINGKKVALNNYLGELHAVIFNADELEIVRGTPEHRRRFLDHGIIGIYPPFTQTLSEYNRIIKQKNALLQSSQENGFSFEKTAEMLEIWNDQLVAIATKVYKARVRYVERLSEVLQKKLFGSEEITIRYVSSLENKADLSDYAAALSERLKLRVQAEIAAGYSLLGTHRDDLEIKFDGRDLRTFGSSGQQRSALLLLQLANLSVYYLQRNEYPLFLLDDIDAELDYKRIGHLLEYLEDKTQTIVTTSKENFINEFGIKARIFSISKGIST